MINRRFQAAAVLAALSLFLSGCLFTPGKFTSELVLSQDNSFEFSYQGQVHFLGLSQLAKMAASEDTGEFDPADAYCFDEETYEARDCTEAEIAEQRAEWQSGASERAAEEALRIKEMSAIMGGLDLSDPEAGAELARKLERQRGWNSVKHMGDGVFQVDFATTGQLSHDFVFPMIEGFPLPTFFVQLILRDDGQVRMTAPGFAVQDGAGAMQGTGLMAGFAGYATLAALGESSGEDDRPSLPQMDGTFTLVTNGQILANNTDEGPGADPRGQTLSWKVNARTKEAPTALIQLAK